MLSRILNFWFPKVDLPASPVPYIPEVEPVPSHPYILEQPEPKMTPSLWQSRDRNYTDKILKKNNKYMYVNYDFPKKRTARNHLVTRGALFFLKTKSGWVLAGVVSKVISIGPDQKFANIRVKRIHNNLVFRNKNEALLTLGFEDINDTERMNGLIPLYRK